VVRAAAQLPMLAAPVNPPQASRGSGCAVWVRQKTAAKRVGEPPLREAGGAGPGDGRCSAATHPHGIFRVLAKFISFAFRTCFLGQQLSGIFFFVVHVLLFSDVWPMRTRTTTAETAASANGGARKLTCTNQITFGPSPLPVRVGQISEKSNSGFLGPQDLTPKGRFHALRRMSATHIGAHRTRQ